MLVLVLALVLVHVLVLVLILVLILMLMLLVLLEPSHIRRATTTIRINAILLTRYASEAAPATPSDVG